MWLAILSGALLSSFALAQTTSHFDVAGNVSFSGSQMAGTSGAQVNSLGWQTSGITHFNRWLSMTSEFSSSNASTNSISLIGYTGSGTVKHYSILAGPRINLPFRGRVTPFVQGLAGYDRANTSLTSGSTYVTGNETQIAYAFGGGTQIGLTRRIGLNVEANYFGSEHTLAFTGWEPSHMQLSAGLVIRLFGVRTQPQIAKESRPRTPTAPAGTESANAATLPTDVQPTVSAVTVSAQPGAPAMQVAPVQVPPPTIQPETKTQLARDTAAVAPVAPQPIPAAQTVQSPAPAPTAEPVIAAAVIVTPTPAIPASNPVTQKPVPVLTPAPVSTPVPAAAAIPVVPAQQVAPTPVAPVQQAVQAQPDQSQPVSLGEYARRLREKKQHSSGSGSSNW